MSRCITWSTGRRPITSATALSALKLQGGWDWDELVIVRWADGAPTTGLTMLDLPGGSRAACHNAGLAFWINRHGDAPDVWFAIDDDMVPCRAMLSRMEAILAADEGIGLLGCWNDGCQRRDDGGFWGETQLVAGEVVQYGRDFNVGGAVQAIPRRTIEGIGVYDERMIWLEDHDLTQRVRQAGQEAAIARSIFAVVLADDGVDEGYRQEMTDTFFAKRKEMLGW